MCGGKREAPAALSFPSEGTRASVALLVRPMSNHKQYTVLVVDDEPFIRMVAIDALEGEGMLVLEAGDAEEAVELLTRHPEVDLLFTDINMPGLDGVKLAERAIKLRPQIRLIVSSGREYRTDQSLPDNGKFLPKPYGPGQLVDLVQRELSALRG